MARPRKKSPHEPAPAFRRRRRDRADHSGDGARHPFRRVLRCPPARARRLCADASRLHRDLCARHPRPRADDGVRRHHLVRPGRISRHRRLCERLVDHGDGRIALRRARDRASRFGPYRLGARRRHLAARRPFPAALDHRLGHRHRLPLRQRRSARIPQRHRRDPAAQHRPARARVGPILLLLRLASPRARYAALVQSPRFARGPGHSRLARRQRARRKPRHRFVPGAALRLRARRPTRRARRLALCAFSKGRQRDGLRPRCRHRVPAHGPNRRCEPCGGRRRRRRHRDALEGGDAILPAARHLQTAHSSRR